MQENNFEKKVQEELDGLRLNPSENVWLHVEASLKKKKDRRVLALLLSLFFLAGAGLLTFNFYNNGNRGIKPQLTAAPATVTEEKPASEASDISKDNLIKTPSTKLTSETAAPGTQQKKPASLLVLTPQKSPAPSAETLPSTAVNSNKTLLYKTGKVRRYIGAKTAVETEGATIETVDEAETTALQPIQPATFNLSGLRINNTRQRLDLPGNFINAQGIVNQTNTSPKQEKPGIKAAAGGKKLSISFEAGIGRSGTANSYLGNIPNDRFYDSSPYSNAAGSGSQVADSLRPYNINPSALKPGAGFFAGILFTKQLSGRSSISAGLRYQLFTTSQSVGASVTYSTNSPQLLDGAYRAGISNSYTNSYHLLQIPLEFNVQLSRFKQHNIFAETGVSVSQLLYTNALQFNNANRQYFKNNSLFNKTTVGFSAGVFVNLRKDAKPSLLLGPSFQYSFTPLANEGLYAKSHYSFLGLSVQKSLKHK